MPAQAKFPTACSTYCFFCRPLYLTSVSLGASFVHFKFFVLITPRPLNCLNNLKNLYSFFLEMSCTSLYSHFILFSPHVCMHQRCISISPSRVSRRIFFGDFHQGRVDPCFGRAGRCSCEQGRSQEPRREKQIVVTVAYSDDNENHQKPPPPSSSDFLERFPLSDPVDF